MKALVLDAASPEFAQLLARRRALGQDRYDEVWEGVYHVVVPGPGGPHSDVDAQLLMLLAPRARRAGLFPSTAFNLGTPENFRVPDGGHHRTPPTSTYLPTAAVVVEIASPGDETYEKIDFYRRHGVEELIIADLRRRNVQVLQLNDPSGPPAAARSQLLDVSAEELTSAILWPGTPEESHGS